MFTYVYTGTLCKSLHACFCKWYHLYNYGFLTTKCLNKICSGLHSSRPPTLRTTILCSNEESVSTEKFSQCGKFCAQVIFDRASTCQAWTQSDLEPSWWLQLSPCLKICMGSLCGNCRQVSGVVSYFTAHSTHVPQIP